MPLRMDNVPGLLPRDLWHDLVHNAEPLLDGGDFYGPEAAGLHLTHVLSLAANWRFQVAMAKVAEDSGGRVRAAPPKGLGRMIGKLDTDHKNMEFPKACCNVDCIRCGITFDDIDGIERGFSVATSRFRALRVKNTFRDDFNARQQSFGYRCILLNLLYSEEGVTWGEVLDDAGGDIEQYWAKAYPDYPFEEMVAPFLERLKAHEALRNSLFAFVGEIQFLHKGYLDMRKRSHFWYKICLLYTSPSPRDRG